MNIIGWQEIVVRLLFAFIMGSATAIAKKWYQTKQHIQSNTLMALGAAMFSILASLNRETEFPVQLIIGIGIVCVSVSFQQQAYTRSISINTVMRLWCAGAVGSVVGFGFFVPAYIGILIVILTNLLFAFPETDFVPNIKQESDKNNSSKSELESVGDRETRYQCLVSCLSANEAEVLASLVQLGKEQELMPTKISSKNMADDSLAPKTEIQVDFICNSKTNSLQLQQVLISLKSKVEVNSASWLNLSSEPSQNTFVREKQNRN